MAFVGEREMGLPGIRTNLTGPEGRERGFSYRSLNGYWGAGKNWVSRHEGDTEWNDSRWRKTAMNLGISRVLRP